MWRGGLFDLLLVVSALPLALHGTTAHAQARHLGSRCAAGCSRHLPEGSPQASLCTLCIADPSGVAAWVDRARPLPPGVLTDVDWRVRWAALQRGAREARQAPQRALADWISATEGDSRALACLTGAYAAGQARKSLADSLEAHGPGATKAVQACAALGRALERRAADDLRFAEPSLRADALGLAAAGLSVSPVRLALDAFDALPQPIAEGVARQLVEGARADQRSLGRELLAVAGADDKPAADRLLASFQALRDANRPLLQAATVAARRQAVETLAPLAPLTTEELTLALDDEAAGVRRLAGVGLARAEGRSLSEAVRVRIDGAVPVSAGEKLRWLRLLQGERDDGRCEALARALWRDRTHPETLRGEALVVLASCGGAASYPELEEAFADASLASKRGALRGALTMPRDPRTSRMVAAALQLDDGPLLEAALTGVSSLGLTGALRRVGELCTHPSEGVRRGSIEVLAFLAPPKAEPASAARLEEDPSPSVRATAARLLGEVGSRRSAAALEKAARGDPDARVKFLAAESLRKLGIAMPSRSSNP